jgi:hypothetical protein
MIMALDWPCVVVRKMSPGEAAGDATLTCKLGGASAG